MTKVGGNNSVSGSAIPDNNHLKTFNTLDVQSAGQGVEMGLSAQLTDLTSEYKEIIKSSPKIKEYLEKTSILLNEDKNPNGIIGDPKEMPLLSLNSLTGHFTFYPDDKTHTMSSKTNNLNLKYEDVFVGWDYLSNSGLNIYLAIKTLDPDNRKMIIIEYDKEIFSPNSILGNSESCREVMYNCFCWLNDQFNNENLDIKIQMMMAVHASSLFTTISNIEFDKVDKNALIKKFVESIKEKFPKMIFMGDVIIKHLSDTKNIERTTNVTNK